MRAIFFDEDDARAVLARLHNDGFDAELEREKLQGEDDDEDHPWAVLSDAPEFVLDLLVDEFDGWLDHEQAPPTVVPPLPPLRLTPGDSPLELPSAPRRIKRPDLLSDFDI